MQLEPITTKVVNLNATHGKMYLMQLYVIKYVSDLSQFGSFLWVLRFPPPIKLMPQDITEILLKVELNTSI